MARTYKFNMERNQHNVELALAILFHRAHDAKDAGDTAAAKRLWERRQRLYDAYERVGFYAGGMAECEWPDWELLDTASRWARGCRMVSCEAHGVGYVE